MKNEPLYCPICNSTRTSKYWAMKGYRLAKCLRCGMVWDSLPTKNLLNQYAKRYFINDNPKGGYANYFEGMRINQKTFADRLKRIEIKYGKGKLLDVGCALGDCLIQAKKLGWKDVKGIEPSNYASDFAKKQGLKVKKGVLKKSTYSPNTFDLVAYQDVLEHIRNPVQELKHVFTILKPGGGIFIVTPNISGLWSRLLGPLWYHYKPREHVVYFSPSTLKKALEKSGFSNIDIKRAYHVMSLEYILNRLRYYSPSLFSYLLKTAQRTAFGNLSFRLYIGEIEVWGQKPKQ